MGKDNRNGPLVMICGLPGSGNRVIAQQFRRSGARAVVEHCHDFRKARATAGAASFIVSPYRSDLVAHARSLMRNAPRWSDAMLATCTRHISKLKPIKICLEEIVATKGYALDNLIRQCGLTPAPWPEATRGPVTDGPLLTPDEFEERNNRPATPGGS